MFLSEQERIASAEQNLINDPATYQTNSVTLVTIHDYGNITIPVGGSLVLFSLQTTCSLTSGISGAVAIQVGSLKYVAGYVYDANSGPPNTLGIKNLGCIVWLPAGTYDVSVVGLTAVVLAVGQMQVGLVQFNDVQASALAHYTNASNSINLTVPDRPLPTGNLKQAVFAVNICTNGALGTTCVVTVDGTAHTDMDESSGVAGTEPINGYYIYKLYIPLSIGVQHTIGIALSGGADAYVSVVACPWILASISRSGHSPMVLGFGQQSTMYVDLAPLFYDTVKNAYIGVKKSVSFGASDFPAQGTAEVGVLSFAYNFQTVHVESDPFVVDGFGGCISAIGVDIS
jgi:hypothetical protein